MKINKTNISVQFLTVSGKKMTISFLKQIHEISLSKLIENGAVVGYINAYYPMSLTIIGILDKRIVRTDLIDSDSEIVKKVKENIENGIIPQLFIGR